MTFEAHTERTFSVRVSNVVADCEEIPFSVFSRAILHVPTGATSATIGFQIAEEEGGTYRPLYDSSGTQVTLAVVAARAYELDSAIAASSWLKIYTNTGTGTWALTAKS